MIDLHVHSTFSDGSLTPEQLVAEAGKIGLTAMALTDHDSVDGIGRFLEACKKADLTGVSGVEISASVPQGTMHMLGYFIDHKQTAFEGALKQIRNGREIRNQSIVEELNALGLDLTIDEVRGYAGEEVVGRPHFAQALIAKGYVDSKQAAFDLYLARGKPAYADRFRLSPRDSIALIRDAGGLAALAHPVTLELDAGALKTTLGELKDAGLQGLEVYYSEHSPVRVSEFRKLAQEFDLVATGGSDFHGEMNPDIALGTGFGSLRVPDDTVRQLEARLGAE